VMMHPRHFFTWCIFDTTQNAVFITSKFFL
jgi:hypothetical protein